MKKIPEYTKIAEHLFKDLRDTLGWIAGEKILIERIELALRRCPHLTGQVTHDITPEPEMKLVETSSNPVNDLITQLLNN